MDTHGFRTFDRKTAERLLRGVPAAGPADGGPLAALLAAAAGPARPDELAGEHATVVAFRTSQSVRPVAPKRSVIKAAARRVLTIPAAAVLAATTAGGVALAAGTGILPNPLSGDRVPAASSSRTSGSGGGAGDSRHGGSSGRAGGSAANGTNGKGSTGGPDQSMVGLCRAYLAGADSEHGKALDSPAFQALITAAGGRDRVDGYCAGVLASAPGNGPSGKSDGNNGNDKTKTKTKTNGTGKPTDKSTAKPSKSVKPQPAPTPKQRTDKPAKTTKDKS